jgi:hypothetical protein
VSSLKHLCVLKKLKGIQKLNTTGESNSEVVKGCGGNEITPTLSTRSIGG